MPWQKSFLNLFPLIQQIPATGLPFLKTKDSGFVVWILLRLQVGISDYE
jgi:hypothetical protein